MDKNPLLREKYSKEFNKYDQGSSSDSDFKSKRGKNKKDGNTDDFGEQYAYRAHKAHKDAETWNETKFMRRYRYAHLRNKTNVPMSIRNEDRHGLANL